MKTVDYVKILKKILKLLNNECAVEEVVMDFERATWFPEGVPKPEMRFRRCSQMPFFEVAPFIGPYLFFVT